MPIKLKSLISENDDGNTFWTDDNKLDYPKFARLSPEDKIEAAMDIISSNNRTSLTEPEVYHIILTLPKNIIKEFYNWVKENNYLTNEQLKNTTSQISVFFK